MLDVRDARQRALSTAVLEEPRIFVAHNARHEITSLQCALGLDISSRTYDTYLVSLLVQPGADTEGVHGLKPLTLLHLDGALVEAQQRLYDRFREIWPGPKNAKWAEIQRYGWNNIPSNDPAYVIYAGLDAIYARRLAPILANEARAQGSYGAIPREQELGRLAAQIASQGWRTDPAFAADLQADYGVRHKEARTEFQTLFGMPTGSPKRVDWLQARDIDIQARTKKNNPSLAAEELRRLSTVCADNAEVSQFLTLALQAAETQNVTQFTESLMLFRDSSDRVHAEINTLHAVTGRMSVTKPALQTVSWRSPVRGVFVPDNPDEILVSADFSQIEPRVFAVYAGERGLAEQVRAGIDVYSAVAQMVGNRKVAKRALLGRAYGSGVRTMTTQIQMLDGLAITEDEVRAALKVVDQSYPGFRRLARSLENLDEVRLESGRVVPVDPDRPYKNVNSLVQGTARDLFCDAMLRVKAAGLADRIRMPIHDEMVFSLPIATLNETLEVIYECMTVPFQWMPVDSEVEVYTEGRWMAGTKLWTRDGWELAA